MITIHGGEEYRLHITGNNRLVLTKQAFYGTVQASHAVQHCAASQETKLIRSTKGYAAYLTPYQADQKQCPVPHPDCHDLNSGPGRAALATDDAGTVDVGKVEIELNGSYSDDKETAFGVTTKFSRADAELKLTTGLCKNLGISLALPYAVNQRIKQDDQLVGSSDGSGDMSVELKYAVAELVGINFTIKPTVILPTGRQSAGLSEGSWQFGGTLIATSEFEDGTYALHANLGFKHHS